MSTSLDVAHTLEIDIFDLPTKAVSFAPTKATIIREIKDIQIKAHANEITVLGLDPRLDPDSVRVEGYGPATITNIQTEIVPRKQQFKDVYPEDDDDDDQSDSDLEALDDNDGPGRVAIDKAKEEVRIAEWALAASKNEQATSVKLLEFLDQYGQSLQAQEVEVSKMNEFLDVYRVQRVSESHRHQKSTADIPAQQEELEKARRKLVRAENAFEKAKKAVTREIREKQEKKARERQQKRQEKQRVLEQRRKFWTSNVSQVVIHLDGLSTSTPGSSRRSSIVSANEKGAGHSSSTSLDGDTVSLLLTYVVPAAKWDPRYELSINTPTSSAKLVYRAEFENQTTETWKNAKVTFSNSQTSFSGLDEKIPHLDPWHIKLAKANQFDTGNKIWANGLRSQSEYPAKSSFTKNTSAAPPSIFSKSEELRRAAPISSTSQALFGSAAPPARASGFGSVRRDAPFTESAPAPAPLPPPPPPAAHVSPFGATQSLFSRAQNEGLFGQRSERQDNTPAELSRENEEDSDDNDDALTLNPELNALGHQDSQHQSYGLTTTYELSGQRTINPSSVKRRNVITELEIKSLTLSHVLVPKLRHAAFLKARITNTTSVSLIRGKAGMTVDGTFLGSTTLPNCEPDNFVDLSLGVDPSIQVTYAKPTVRRASSGFFNKDESAIFTRTCWIKNTKKVTASITVFDQVPVSEDEHLRVNILEPKGLDRENDSVKLDAILDGGKKGKGQVHLGKNGQVKWTIDLRPGKDVKLVLEYESRIPSGQKIIGLD
ncbi:hypothetical protein BGW36DRAFT_372249 [Talaromyces proteolyticus]|uniref:DUF4139 domain-containing protein n=1 Tax=Talaromyces proteolyticus TaxID=1131652 RepID=A0AAD4Q1C2_9EURO|nr:uncharacterized protein BGW36DRAFT_372249 [Talaromyces proteolyticus]KAH8702124.1 hypothetical protein BGW36DRAFT_372249 [Talaromyces proteolyticus]